MLELGGSDIVVGSFDRCASAWNTQLKYLMIEPVIPRGSCTSATSQDFCSIP